MKHWLIQQLTKIKKWWQFERAVSELPPLMNKLSKEVLFEPPFRLATIQDLELFETLQYEAYQGYIAWKKTDFLNDWRNNPYCVYIVIEENQQVIGLINGRIRHKGAHISHLIVTPTYQDKGMGTKLLDQWMKVMDYFQCPIVTLEVRESNVKAQYVYQKAGFKIMDVYHNYYHDNRENALVMRKDKEG